MGRVLLIAAGCCVAGGRASRRWSSSATFVVFRVDRRHFTKDAQAQGHWERLDREPRPKVSLIDLTRNGPAGYVSTQELQRRLVDERVKNATTDSVVLVEHEPVYTLGRGATEEHVLFDSRNEDSPLLVRCERGGDVTYHGPGQLVAYPVLQLSEYKRDSHWYLRALEEVVIRTCASFGAPDATRHHEHTGVWLRGHKISAVGVALRRWVTYHGVSLNVSPRMADFDRIVPCGLDDEKVGSLEGILQKPIALHDVVRILFDLELASNISLAQMPVFLSHFEDVFEVSVIDE